MPIYCKETETEMQNNALFNQTFPPNMHVREYVQLANHLLRLASNQLPKGWVINIHQLAVYNNIEDDNMFRESYGTDNRSVSVLVDYVHSLETQLKQKRNKQKYIDALNTVTLAMANAKKIANEAGFMLPHPPYYGELKSGDKCVDCGCDAVTTLDGAPMCYDCWNSEH